MGQGRDSDPRRCEKEGYLMPLEDLLVVAMISRRKWMHRCQLWFVDFSLRYGLSSKKKIQIETRVQGFNHYGSWSNPPSEMVNKNICGRLSKHYQITICLTINKQCFHFKQNISKIAMEGAPWLVFPQFYGRACGRTNINWTGSTTSDSPDCCPAALLESSCIYNTTYT